MEITKFALVLVKCGVFCVMLDVACHQVLIIKLSHTLSCITYDCIVRTKQLRLQEVNPKVCVFVIWGVIVGC